MLAEFAGLEHRLGDQAPEPRLPGRGFDVDALRVVGRLLLRGELRGRDRPAECGFPLAQQLGVWRLQIGHCFKQRFRVPVFVPFTVDQLGEHLAWQHRTSLPSSLMMASFPSYAGGELSHAGCGQADSSMPILEARLAAESVSTVCRKAVVRATYSSGCVRNTIS